MNIQIEDRQGGGTAATVILAAGVMDDAVDKAAEKIEGPIRERLTKIVESKEFADAARLEKLQAAAQAASGKLERRLAELEDLGSGGDADLSLSAEEVGEQVAQIERQLTEVRIDLRKTGRLLPVAQRIRHLYAKAALQQILEDFKAQVRQAVEAGEDTVIDKLPKPLAQYMAAQRAWTTLTTPVNGGPNALIRQAGGGS